MRRATSWQRFLTLIVLGSCWANAQSTAPQGTAPQRDKVDAENGGLNWYPTDSRNYRLNLQAANVYRSPVSSAFGFYTGGLKGVSFALGATLLF